MNERFDEIYREIHKLDSALSECKDQIDLLTAKLHQEEAANTMNFNDGDFLYYEFYFEWGKSPRVAVLKGSLTKNHNRLSYYTRVQLESGNCAQISSYDYVPFIYNIRLATKEEIDEFHKILADQGIRWDPIKKSVVPIPLQRVSPYADYYFISGDFSHGNWFKTAKAMDCYVRQDNINYDSGNYFFTLAEAENFLNENILKPFRERANHEYKKIKI